MGSPPISARGLFGRRVAARRDGIRTMGSDMARSGAKRLWVLNKAGTVCHGLFVIGPWASREGPPRDFRRFKGCCDHETTEIRHNPIVKTPSLRLSNATSRALCPRAGSFAVMSPVYDGGGSLRREYRDKSER